MSRNKQVVLWLCALALLLGWALNPSGGVRAADVPLAGEIQQTTDNPNGEPPEDPNGEVPEDPGGDPPEAPNGETPEYPDGDPPEDPDGEAPEDPDGDPPEDPDGEAPEDPDGDPPEDPDGGTSGDLEGGTPEEPSEGAGSPQVYIESLGTRTLAEGDELYYQTVAPKFADNPYLPDNYYPGALTVQVDGQVTVGAGAVLAIGTLSIGGTQELSPLIQGAGGQIVVQAGGELSLTDVEIAWTGEEPLIVQEPGAVVSLYACQSIPEGAIQWAAPVVDNAFQNPGDIWLMEGTPLTAEDLPQQLNTYLVTQGGSEWTTLSLKWDFSPYQGQTQGSITLTGQFLDENGAVLESRAPLTVTVHWYPAGTLVVTKADWIGDTVPVARLALSEIPQEADRVWGEVSEDDGVTWTEWEDCNQLEILENNTGGLLVFVMPDTTPRLFRAVAENRSEHLYWVSEAFLLPSEDSDDQGGNRGGSTLPETPDRSPAPVPGGDGDDGNEPEDPQPPENSPAPSPGDGWGNTWEPQPTPDQPEGNSGQGGGEPDQPQPGQPPEPEPSEPSGIETPQPAPGPSRPGYTQQILQWVVRPHAIQDTGGESLALPPAASTQPSPSAGVGPEADSGTTAPAVSDSQGEVGDASSPPAADWNPAELADASPAPAASGDLTQKEESSPAPAANGSQAKSDTASPTPVRSAHEQAPALPLQIGLAAAGVGVCTLVGLGAAGKGPFRRKR